MKNVLLLIVVLIALGIIWSLPLYVCINLVSWLFHIPVHITLLQSFGVCLLATVIRNLLFKKGDD